MCPISTETLIGFERITSSVTSYDTVVLHLKSVTFSLVKLFRGLLTAWSSLSIKAYLRKRKGQMHKIKTQ